MGVVWLFLCGKGVVVKVCERGGWEGDSNAPVNYSFVHVSLYKFDALAADGGAMCYYICFETKRWCILSATCSS